jgi:hypothetical protein
LYEGVYSSYARPKHKTKSDTAGGQKTIYVLQCALDSRFTLWQHERRIRPEMSFHECHTLSAGNRHVSPWKMDSADGQKSMRAISPPGWRAFCASPCMHSHARIRRTLAGERFSFDFSFRFFAVIFPASIHAQRLLAFLAGRCFFFCHPIRKSPHACGLSPNKLFCSRNKESGPFCEGSVLSWYRAGEKRAG